MLENNTDKKLIKKNFQKSLLTYDDNAIVQKQMAKKLVTLIKNKKDNFDNILEIGSYTGVLTKETVNKIKFKNYLAVDILESSLYVKKIDEKINFLNKDIDEFNTEEKFDLIISNASLQWSKNLYSTIKKLQSFKAQNGIIALSLFSEKNLYQIKDIFGIGLNYPKISEIKEIFPNFDIFQEQYDIKFDTPLEVLRHLKYTGVNSIQKNQLNYKEIKQKLLSMKNKYDNVISYDCIYIIN